MEFYLIKLLLTGSLFSIKLFLKSECATLISLFLNAFTESNMQAICDISTSYEAPFGNYSTTRSRVFFIRGQRSQKKFKFNLNISHIIHR